MLHLLLEVLEVLAFLSAFSIHQKFLQTLSKSLHIFPQNQASHLTIKMPKPLIRLFDLLGPFLMFLAYHLQFIGPQTQSEVYLSLLKAGYS